MSDYSNTFGGAAKDANNDLILGADHDTEYSNIATMSATKANKVSVATNNNVVAMDANGDMKDAGFLLSAVCTLTGTQTLTNKTLTSPIISSVTWSGNIGASNLVTYDNTTSGLSATNVKTALDELTSEKLQAASNLSDVGSAATAFSNIKQAASTTATGVVELATDAEAEAGTDTSRAITAANLKAAVGFVGGIYKQTSSVDNLASGATLPMHSAEVDTGSYFNFTTDEFEVKNTERTPTYARVLATVRLSDSATAGLDMSATIWRRRGVSTLTSWAFAGISDTASSLNYDDAVSLCALIPVADGDEIFIKVYHSGAGSELFVGSHMSVELLAF